MEPINPPLVRPAMRKFQSCTFEASTAWRQLLRQFPLKERSLDGDGFRLYFWTDPLYAGAISTPFRDRIAVAWDDKSSTPDIDFTASINQFGFDDLILKDVGSLASNSFQGDKRLVSQYVNCEVILDENIENRFKNSARWSFRKAKSNGLRVDVNPHGIFEAFYNMHLSTRHRLGVLPYPKSFFSQLFELRHDAVVIFACNSSQGFLGFLLCYLHGPEMISGHMMYNFEMRQQRISDFLYMFAFLWGRDNGFSHFRFGADNRNQISLIKSKQKLGAIARKQWDFHLKKKVFKEDNPNSPLRRCLRSAPSSMFRHMGHATHLYFG